MLRILCTASLRHKLVVGGVGWGGECQVVHKFASKYDNHKAVSHLLGCMRVH
jgi:hypothetical protein